MNHTSSTQIRAHIRGKKRFYGVLSLMLVTMLAGGVIAGVKAQSGFKSKISIETDSPSFSDNTSSQTQEAENNPTPNASPTMKPTPSPTGTSSSDISIKINSSGGSTQAHVETNGSSQTSSTNSESDSSVKVESSGDAKVDHNPKTGEVDINGNNFRVNITSDGKSEVEQSSRIRSRTRVKVQQSD